MIDERELMLVFEPEAACLSRLRLEDQHKFASVRHVEVRRKGQSSA